jgi:hypothetical protein
MVNVAIKEWQDIQEDYKGTLVLGNGSSLAIDKKFKYEELYKHSVTQNWINDEIVQIFKDFQTEDFERILKSLYDASRVVDSLKETDAKEKVDNAYNIVRNSLILAVRAIHPNLCTINDHISAIATFIPRFKNIVSLNYDLILYWACMEANKNPTGHYCKDAFCGNGLTLFDDPVHLYEPREKSGERSITLVWYPHGTFFLNASLKGESESKTNRIPPNDLLDTVIEKWESKKTIPLFVSEGESKLKKQAIRRSDYLSIVYNEMLPNLVKHPKEHDESLLIYGWSMSDQDDHIIKQLVKNKFKRVAIAIHELKNKNEDEQKMIKEDHKKMLLFQNTDIEHIDLFDSKDGGVWNNNLMFLDETKDAFDF